MKRILLFFFAVFFMASCTEKEYDLTTTFEKSNYLETDDYENTVIYAKRLAKRFKQVHYQSIGVTSQGRETPIRKRFIKKVKTSYSFNHASIQVNPMVRMPCFCLFVTF